MSPAQHDDEATQPLLGRRTRWYLAILAIVVVVAYHVSAFFFSPRFADLYGVVGGSLPTPTRRVIAISEFLRAHWLVNLMAVSAVALLAASALHTEPVRALWRAISARPLAWLRRRGKLPTVLVNVGATGLALVLVAALPLAYLLPTMSLSTGPGDGSPDSGPGAVDRALDELPWGSASLDAPGQVELNAPFILRLTLTPLHSATELGQMVKAGADGVDVRIAPEMEALLQARAFEVASVTPERQAVSGRSPTEWTWDASGSEGGKHHVFVSLLAQLEVNGERIPRVVQTFEHVIDVDMTLAQWIGTQAVAVPFAALLLIAVAVRLTVARRKRSREGDLRGSQAPLRAVRDPESEHEVFVSYSRRDAKEVMGLVAFLRTHDIRVWLDQGGIDAAKFWAEEIILAIQRCKVLVVAASPSAFASSNVQREVQVALEEEKPILPVFLSPAEIPPGLRYSLAGIQYIELYRGDRNEQEAAILTTLRRLGIADTPMRVD